MDPGPYHRLATLPLNEQCSVSISHKVFEHPRLPASWSGLRMLHLSDWHFEGTIGRDYFERVAELSAREPVDLVVFTGDLLDHPRGLDWLPTTLGRLTAPLGCWFILGNHDWSYSNPEDVRRRLRDIGWQFAAPGGVAIPFRSGTVHLAGDETPWLGRPAEFDNRDLESPQFRILLSHTPIIWPGQADECRSNAGGAHAWGADHAAVDRPGLFAKPLRDTPCQWRVLAIADSAPCVARPVRAASTALAMSP